MRARWSTDTRTSGGSSDTDVKAFAVIACTSAPSASAVVTTVTPVQKRPSVVRICAAEICVALAIRRPSPPVLEVGGVSRDRRLRRRERDGGGCAGGDGAPGGEHRVLARVAGLRRRRQDEPASPPPGDDVSRSPKRWVAGWAPMPSGRSAPVSTASTPGIARAAPAEGPAYLSDSFCVPGLIVSA
jgi:hypothetical protein